MKYLCIVYVDEKKLHAMSEAEGRALTDLSLEHDDALKKSGHFIAAQALQSVTSAATLRIKSSKVSVTDGPFAETNEQLGGFILIEARDLNEAIQIASKIPVLRLGCIEVRPIMALVHSKTGAKID